MQEPESAFDLRKFPPGEHDRFLRSVTNGNNQMPPWGDLLKGDDIEVLWAYVTMGEKNKRQLPALQTIAANSRPRSTISRRQPTVTWPNMCNLAKVRFAPEAAVAERSDHAPFGNRQAQCANCRATLAETMPMP